ncbi:MAG TPA: hypothetical protein VLT33_15580 [Labilithrix sp.]|nr:hypothetical protein [Labilithrix sp.]
MRSSSFALFGTALVALVTTASGCRIEAHTQTAFEDQSVPARVSTKDWKGETITIDNAGINPLGGTGGVEVKVDPAATKITINATISALADDDKKADAELNRADVLQTYQIIETATSFDIKCGHGNGHGTSGVAGSGCKILRVTIPPGTALQPHNLTVGNGNGSIRVGLADAGGIPYVKKLLVDNNGLGDVSVRANPVKDADLKVTGEGAVAVALPSNFSVAKVTFTVDEADPTKAGARIITTGFPGMTNGASYPAAGPTADAAATLDVESKGPFSSDTITVSSF